MTETPIIIRPKHPRKVYVQAGDVVRLELPHSEVCMHMQVAGQVRYVQVTGSAYPMAQILGDDGSNFSFPIGTGEAGLFTDDQGLYCYPVLDLDELADALAYAVLLACFAEYGFTSLAVVRAFELVLSTDAIAGSWEDMLSAQFAGRS
jgi:hypothetical protein